MYDYKLIIDESLEVTNDSTYSDAPYLSNAVVYDCTSGESRLTIGGTVSNKLVVNYHNPPVVDLDGIKLELKIKPRVDANADGASEVTLSVTDAQEFIDDIEGTTIDINEDTASDISMPTIAEEFPEDSDSTNYDYEYSEDESETGEDSEIPTNDNYRDSGEVAEEQPTEDTPNDTEEWYDFGTYYVTGIKKLDDTTYQLTALDGFVLMADAYNPTIESGTIDEYYADYSTQLETLGINVATEVFPEATINWSMNCSYRDAAGYFATFCGAYATFGREGYLDLRQYAKNDEYIPYNELLDYAHTADPISINAMACNTSTIAGSEKYIKLGEDDTIEMKFTNPLMNETILQKILDRYLYTQYQPCTINAEYHVEYQSGDIIEMEYEQGSREWVCITNQTIDLDSNRTKIESLGDSATLAANTVISETDKKIGNVATEASEMADEAAKTATSYISEEAGQVDAFTGFDAVRIGNKAQNHMELTPEGFEIKDGNSTVVSGNGTGRTIESIARIQTSPYDERFYCITPTKYIVSVISLKDAENNYVPYSYALSGYNPASGGLPDQLTLMIESPSDVTLPLTMEYIACDDYYEYNATKNLTVDGTAEFNGNIRVNGLVEGVIGWYEVSYSVPSMKANGYAGVSIRWDEIGAASSSGEIAEGVENPAMNMVPIGIIGWGVTGTGNGVANVYRAQTVSTDENFAYFGIRNLGSTAIKEDQWELVVRILCANISTANSL